MPTRGANELRRLGHVAGARRVRFLSACARFMSAQGGPSTIIQVTGGSARRGMPGRGLWGAGAFAVRALTQAAASELREQEIQVALLIIDATIDRSGGDD